jgi:hypothetical protein
MGAVVGAAADAEVVDTEMLALLEGLKPALRITAPPGEAERVTRRFRARGLAVLSASSAVPIDGRVSAILYVARATREAAALRDAEARVLPGHLRGEYAAPEAHRELGRRLGFPRCCVDAFCDRVERGVDRLAGGPRGLAEDYVAAREAWVERPDPRINNLLFSARLKLVSFYPCRYDCAVALRFAAAVHDALQRRAPEAAERLLGALSRHVVIAPSNGRAVVTLDEGGAIARAEPPRSPDGRVVAPEDQALADSLCGAVVKGGEVEGSGAPSAWFLAFGPQV